jgi:DNA-binding transcriptional ArsR family regulator
LIAQLATSRGIRAPLAQIANQVFVDLVRELERQGVSRKVSADMFGMGLRTYRRKIQRLSESSTERGRSLWEVVLEYVRENSLVSRPQVLSRFSGDDEAQVKAVLRDLCESQLIFASGSGVRTAYRPATVEETAVLQRARGVEGDDELLVSLIYREAPMTLSEIAARVQTDAASVEASLERLVTAGRVEVQEQGGERRYRAQALVIPLGAAGGWEGAVFDHFKALVTTVLWRVRDNRPAALEDQIGGSTYTIDVWDGHPLEEEVTGTLSRVRAALSDLRTRVAEYNNEHDLPSRHARVVIYAGQCVVLEDQDAYD